MARLSLDDEACARAFVERVSAILEAFPDETPTAFITAAVALARDLGIPRAQLQRALDVAWNVNARVEGN